jgi:hypothetical protein
MNDLFHNFYFALETILHGTDTCTRMNSGLDVLAGMVPWRTSTFPLVDTPMSVTPFAHQPDKSGLH